jgi:DegV family protein with EDD domain
MERKSNVALLTDSTSDLPQELIERYQIHIVPLSLHFGDTYYLDRLTINPDQFVRRLEASEVNPTTSQPTSKDFQNKYEYLGTLYESVMGMHLSAAMSGTYSNSLVIGKEVSERSGTPVKVIDSKVITGGLGLLVIRAARALEEGMPYDELSAKVQEWIPRIKVRVTVQTLKYIVRTGRVSPAKSFIARMLNLKPVIAIDDTGRTFSLNKSFTEQSARKKVIAGVEQILKKNRIWEYAVTHAGNPEAAGFFASEMFRLTGRKPLYLEHASPVLIANTGPGVACLSLMLE